MSAVHEREGNCIYFQLSSLSLFRKNLDTRCIYDEYFRGVFRKIFYFESKTDRDEDVSFLVYGASSAGKC